MAQDQKHDPRNPRYYYLHGYEVGTMRKAISAGDFYTALNRQGQRMKVRGTGSYSQRGVERALRVAQNQYNAGHRPHGAELAPRLPTTPAAKGSRNARSKKASSSYAGG